MRYTFISLMAFAFLSCGLGESSANKEGLIKKSLLGSWTNDTSGKTTMEINKGDIYYPWMPAKFPYKIVGDTIELTRVDGTTIGQITWNAKAVFKNDSLFVIERDGVAKYWRVKPNKQRTTSDL